MSPFPWTMDFTGEIEHVVGIYNDRIKTWIEPDRSGNKSFSRFEFMSRFNKSNFTKIPQKGQQN